MLKVQVFSDNRENIVSYSGPHIGSIHDLSIFYHNYPIILPNERILADKAYCGTRAKHLCVLSSFKKIRGRRLSDEKTAFNQLHSFYRLRFEHAIGYLKRFQIISCKYRGRVVGKAIPFISKVVKLLIHLNFIQTSNHPIRGVN